MEHAVISIRTHTMFRDKMNLCVEEHVPKYKVTYKPAKEGQYIPVWLVCEECLDRRKCFGSDDEVVFVEPLE